jgi:hypothetical protein
VQRAGTHQRSGWYAPTCGTGVIVLVFNGLAASVSPPISFLTAKPVPQRHQQLDATRRAQYRLAAIGGE